MEHLEARTTRLAETFDSLECRQNYLYAVELYPNFLPLRNDLHKFCQCVPQSLEVLKSVWSLDREIEPENDRVYQLAHLKCDKFTLAADSLRLIVPLTIEIIVIAIRGLGAETLVHRLTSCYSLQVSLGTFAILWSRAFHLPELSVDEKVTEVDEKEQLLLVMYTQGCVTELGLCPGLVVGSGEVAICILVARAWGGWAGYLLRQSIELEHYPLNELSDAVAALV